MDHLSRLPVECLENILRYIVGAPPSKSRPALSALCRVNRYISGVATSILYHNPFNLLTGNAVYFDRGHRLRCLLTTLLTNIPTSQIHEALLLGLVARIEPETNTNTDAATLSYISVNHLRHIRYFSLPTYTFLEYGRGGLENKNYTPEELGYISGQDLLEMYLLDRKDATCSSKNPSSQLQEYYSNVLYREATWSLAEPILEQLESLSFPLSDIRRYLMLVGRLVRLASVHVHLDMVFYCDCCEGSDIPQEPRRLRKKGAFRDLVQFVEAHVRIFPGRLKTVTTSNAGFWEEGTQSCPIEVEHEIYKMLPSQYQPTSISEYNWRKVAAHLETIDLSMVWEIKWLPSREVVDHEWILRRCRGLNRFAAQALPARCFDWAVQEKMNLERLGQGHASTNTTTVVGPVPTRRPPGRQQQDILLGSTPPQPAHVRHGLVKLGRIVLEECRMPSRDLDAAVFAFSQSLYMLGIEALLGPENTRSIHIGREWCTVPSLAGLELQAHTHRLVLDPLLFTRLPRLKNPKIKDETFEYSCEDVVPCELAQGTALSVVYLRGWSALVFNPSALEWSKELVVLKLSMARQDGYCFIPPVDELNASYGLGSNAVPTSIARPRWTWDWDFPILVEINLTSEFAYMFEFWMLHRCPRLDTLRLHMRTVDSSHTRTISEADLFVSRTDGSRERIVAPKLRKVYMNGHWVFSSASVLSQFLGQMFPAVERLTARGWGNVSIGSLAEALRTTAGHIRMSPSTIPDHPFDQMNSHAPGSDSANSTVRIRKRKLRKFQGIFKFKSKEVKPKASNQSLHFRPASQQLTRPSSIVTHTDNVLPGDKFSPIVTKVDSEHSSHINSVPLSGIVQVEHTSQQSTQPWSIVSQVSGFPSGNTQFTCTANNQSTSPTSDNQSTSSSTAKKKALPGPLYTSRIHESIFDEEVPKPTMKTELPQLQKHIEMMQQLVYCNTLLLRDTLSPSKAATGEDAGNSSPLVYQEPALDKVELNWLETTKKDLMEADRLRWLATWVVEQCVTDANKDFTKIAEIVALGPVLEKEHYRKLLSTFIDEFDDDRILDVNMLQGLVQLAQDTSPGYLESDDL
ncbi:hypothetical protein BGX30_013594, partial [Mortierella sp. GBA39]